MAELTTEELRSKATKLGIKFTKSTPDDVLLDKIEAKEKLQAATVNLLSGHTPLTALKRIKVTPLNPLERNIEGKYFLLHNSFASIKRMVPFRVPTHAEVAIIQMIEDSKYIQMDSNIDKIAKGKVGSGEKPEPREVKAYQVEYLPDLTKAELEAMKKDKTMRDVTIKDEV